MNLSNLKPIIANLASYFGLAEEVESVSTVKAIERLSDGTTPLDDYLSYRYFDEEKELFISDGNVVGFMVEIAPIVGVDDGMYKNLQHFFNDELPEHSYLQFLLVASHEVEDILDHWQRDRTNQSPLLKKITEKRADFIRQQAIAFGQSDGRIARDYRIFVSFSQITDTKHQDFSDIVSFKVQLLNKFESLQLAPQVCNASDLITLVRTMLQMEFESKAANSNLASDYHAKTKPIYDHKTLLSRQIVSPAEVQQISEHEIKHLSTNLTSRCYHIKELPMHFSLLQMINLLGCNVRSSMGIAARFIISYSIASNISGTGAHSICGRGKKVIDAADKWYTKNDRALKREAAEWQDIIDRSSEGERFLTEHWHLMVTSTKSTIDIVEQSLISLYNINNFKLAITKNLQFPAQLSMLPMQQALTWNILNKFKLTRLALSKEVIARLPIHAEWRGVPKSGVLLHGRRGQLFNFNPFYKITSGNYNICIFAPSGGGKSVFLQELAVSQMAQDTRMFILDIGQSFANICSLLEGETIQFGKDSPFSLNPFASFHKGMNPNDKDEFLKCTKSLLEVMCNVGDDARGAADLEKAMVAALFESNYTLDISAFAKFLENSKSSNLKKYGATLYPYTQEGLYGKYFSGTKVASFKRLITVFEFEEIKNDPKLLSIVLQILLMEVTNQFLTGDRQTPFMIIVDEAWMLLDFAASFFAAFVRTVRKYGGSLVICVQNFMDLQKTQDHKTILENSTWTILLKQDEKGLGAFKESEAFKDMIPLIRSVSLLPNKYAEMLLYTTGVTVIGRLVLDDYSNALYSTNSEDFNFLRKNREQGVGLDEAVEELVLRKRASNK
jgi:conjugal transfer ATP-binding protein TraC